MRNGMTRAATLILGAFIVACGSSPPPAPEPGPPAAPAAPAAAAEGPAAAAEPAPPPATSAAATPEPPGAPNAPPTAGIIAQGHDECSGVAAPFEEKVRAKFNECYQTGKKKNPELAGTIKVTLKVDTKGKVKYVPDPSKLDKPAYDCMVSAVKKEPFDAKACKGKDVAVSKTFGPG